MIRKLIILVFLFLLIFLNSETKVKAQQQTEETLEAKIIFVLEEKKITFAGSEQTYQRLQLEVTKGSKKGQTIYVENGNIPTSNPIIYKRGDVLTISKTVDSDGHEDLYITDFVRRDSLLVLFLLFAVISIAIGGVRGSFSILGMFVSFLVIFKIIIPLILRGIDPVLVSIGGSVLIIPVTFYLSHGISKKTHIATVGTLMTLMITGFLATLFVDLTKLTGFASEEAGFLQSQIENIVNMKGLLLAGIIIASLGILDDITISQTSIVLELKNANAKLGTWQLFARAMKVGRDHISSLVNTLVLVYAGSSLPLLLLFTNSGRSFVEIVNYEIVADEIVRTLVGSIGLIFAVPITTLIAAIYFSKLKKF